MTSEQDRCPPAPEHKATGVSVLLEPMIGSGERICIAVAVVIEDGEHRIERTVSDQKLHCLFGDEATGISRLINMATDSLTRHLADVSITEWQPPVEGITLRGPLPMTIDSLDMGIKTLLTNFSCLDHTEDEA